MTLEMVVIWALVGLVAGWLASQFVRGGGSGTVADIVIGIVGAFIGGFVFRSAGWHVPLDGYPGVIFVAFIGAVILLAVMRLVGRSRRRA